MKQLPLIILLNLILALNVWSKKFANQYCSFELPTGWECSLEGSEWVCQSNNKARRREAIIILAAKVRGPQDSLLEYQAYLKKRKKYTLPGGKTQVSEAKYTKVKNINAHRWIDALHLASEVPGFYTRYLATIKADLGMAITFSVGKEHYAAYQGVFDKVVATLRVFAQKKGKFVKVRPKEDNLFENDPTFVPEEIGPKITQRKQGKSKGGKDDVVNYLIIALAVGAGIFIIRKKKKKK